MRPINVVFDGGSDEPPLPTPTAPEMIALRR
jgi:hypothetical protein